MAKGFNLTAELNLRGPSNIRQVVSGIRKQLTGINANVNVVFNAQVAQQVKNANQSFQSFNKTLQQTRSVATSASSALNQLSSASAKLSGNFKSIPNNIQAAANASKQISQSNTQAAKATAALTTEFEEFGKQSALAVRRFAAFATVTGAIYKVSNAISNATSDFLEFQRELIKVSQVTDTSLTGLNFLVNNITQLSTSLGVSSKELVGVSRTLAQAGLSATETSKALKALALSALAPTFDNLNNTVEGSIALMKQFSISANELEGALGSINAVAGRFAVEASDIITAISRTGGVFASASQGVSQGTDALNEFIAVFTSVRATTRESAETIATGLRTIFTRIQREDTIDALKAYGVALTDLNGKFVGPFEATRRLAEGLRSLDPRDIRFSRIVEELGGFRQIGKVIPLIQQFSTAQAALNVAQQGSSSLARDAAAAQLGFANQITKVQEQFDAFIRSIGQTSEFRDLVRLTLDLTSGLISIADAAKTALPALTAIFAIKGFSALSQFGKGFLGGIKRGGGQGLNSGGYVQHFARGGMVPGSGNRDTVKARLTPGEFVIRKKAVQAIGQDRLHAMNKYASGGKVTDFSLSSGLAQDPNSVPTWKKQKGKPFRRAGKNPHRFNPEDEFTYKKIEQTFDVSKADKRNPAVKQAVAVYDNAVRTGDARGRGRAFEGVLSAAGLVILSSGGEKKGNPRLDGFNTRGGGVAEIKSTKEQIDIANINAKMIGAALDPVGQSDLDVQKQFLSNTLRNKPDKINLGTVTVWQDTTSGLGVLPEQKQQSRKNNRNLGGYIQKFAAGGIVDDIKQNANLQVGAAILESTGARSQNLQITKPDIVNAFQRKAGFNPKTEQINEQTLNIKNFRGITGVKQGLSQETSEAFRSAIDQGLVEAVNYAGGKLSTDLGIGFTAVDEGSKRSFLNGVNDASVGNLYEDVLTGIAGVYSSRKSGQNFDFPGGLGSNLKDNYPGLPAKWVDAKASAKEATYTGDGSLKAKALNQIGQEVAASRQIYIQPRAQGTSQDQPKSLDPSRTYLLAELKQFGIDNAQQAKEKGLVSPFRGKWQVAQQRNLGGAIQKFAVGGSAQDTVPALLTPGEFVINKQAASRIGSQRLHKLNRADKIKGYNKGGAVGRVQRFANGGDVFDFADNISAVSAAAEKAMDDFLAGIVDKIIQAQPDISFDDAYREAQTTAGGRVAFGTMQAAQAGDQGAAKAVYDAQRKQVVAITAQIRSNNKSITIAEARAAAERQVAQNWGGLVQKVKQGQRVQQQVNQSGQKLVQAQNQNAQAQQQSAAGGRTGRFGSLSNMGTTAAFAIPLLANQLGDSIGGTTGAGVASAATAFSSSFGVGAQFGPIGAFVGALTGAVAAVEAFSSGVAAKEAEIAQTKIDQAIEGAERSFEAFNKNVGDAGAFRDIANSLATIRAEEQKLSASQQKAEEPGIFTSLGRSIGLLSAPTAQELGGAEAARQRGGAELAQRTIQAGLAGGLDYDQLNAKLAESGQSMDILINDILAADTAYQEQIAEIKSRNLTATQEERAIQSATASKRDQIEQDIKLQSTQAAQERASAKLTKSILVAIASINRTFNNLDQSITVASNGFKQASSEINKIITGATGFSRSFAALETIQNPRAFARAEQNQAIRQGSQFAGADRAFMQQLSRFSLDVNDIIGGIAATGQRTGEDPNITAQKTIDAVTDALEAQFGQTQITEQIRNELTDALKKAVTTGGDVDIQKLLENRIPEFNIGQRAVESTTKALQLLSESFNFVSNAVNEYAKINQTLRDNEASYQGTLLRADLALKEALGKRVDVRERVRARQSEAATRAGVAPQQLTGAALGARRDDLQARVDRLGDQLEQARNSFDSTVPGATQQLLQLEKQFASAENELKSTEDAIGNLPKVIEGNINDIIGEIGRVQQELAAQQQAGANFAERLVGSTPQELAELSGSFNLLNNTLNGQITTINQSQAAQQAYFQSLRNGSSQQEAYAAAQQAFAGQTRSALGLFNELTQLSGLEGPEINSIRADLLENFARAQGMGVQNNPMFQQILEALRRPPEEDPQIRALRGLLTEQQTALTSAMNEVNEGILQKQADILQSANQTFVSQLEQVRLKFDEAQLNQMSLGISRPGATTGARPLQDGGVVYASKGQYVNYQPKGTDTVPAMLTPGEFVVNAKSTKNNLGLLRAINSSAGSGKTFSKGGVVYAAGGLEGMLDDIAAQTDALFNANRSASAGATGAKAGQTGSLISKKYFQGLSNLLNAIGKRFPSLKGLNIPNLLKLDVAQVARNPAARQLLGKAFSVLGGVFAVGRRAYAAYNGGGVSGALTGTIRGGGDAGAERSFIGTQLGVERGGYTDLAASNLTEFGSALTEGATAGAIFGPPGALIGASVTGGAQIVGSTARETVGLYSDTTEAQTSARGAQRLEQSARPMLETAPMSSTGIYSARTPEGPALEGFSPIERTWIRDKARIDNEIKRLNDKSPRTRADEARLNQLKQQRTTHDADRDSVFTQRTGDISAVGYFMGYDNQDVAYAARTDQEIDQAIQQQQQYETQAAEQRRIADTEAQRKRDERNRIEGERAVAASQAKAEQEQKDREYKAGLGLRPGATEAQVAAAEERAAAEKYADVTRRRFTGRLMADVDTPGTSANEYAKNNKSVDNILSNRDRLPPNAYSQDTQNAIKERESLYKEIEDTVNSTYNPLGYNPYNAASRQEFEEARNKRLAQLYQNLDSQNTAINREHQDKKYHELDQEGREKLWAQYESGQKREEAQARREEIAESRKLDRQKADQMRAVAQFVGIQPPDKFANPSAFFKWRETVGARLQKQFPFASRTPEALKALGIGPDVVNALYQPFSPDQAAAIYGAMLSSTRLSGSQQTVVAALRQSKTNLANKVDSDPRLQKIIASASPEDQQAIYKQFKQTFGKQVRAIGALSRVAANFGYLNPVQQRLASANLYQRAAKSGLVDSRLSDEENINRLNAMGGGGLAGLLYPGQQTQNRAIRFNRPRTASKGGVIYASTGMMVPYEPRGTDTVPAMLTPGEFVINRAATQKHRPLLEAINRSKGGAVRYLQEGGSTHISKFVQGVPIESPLDQSDSRKQDEILSNIKTNTDISKQANSRTQNIDRNTNQVPQRLNDNNDILKDNSQNIDNINTNADQAFGNVFDQLNFITASIASDRVDPQNANQAVQLGNIQLALDTFSAQILGFASGGKVPLYAQKGTMVNYQPHGTDTVPAMLTPGEFVVNAKASKENLGLLQAINSGYMNDGGVVYAQNGGIRQQREAAAARAAMVERNRKVLEQRQAMGEKLKQNQQMLDAWNSYVKQSVRGNKQLYAFEFYKQLRNGTIARSNEILKQNVATLAGNLTNDPNDFMEITESVRRAGKKYSNAVSLIKMMRKMQENLEGFEFDKNASGWVENNRQAQKSYIQNLIDDLKGNWSSDVPQLKQMFGGIQELNRGGIVYAQDGRYIDPDDNRPGTRARRRRNRPDMTARVAAERPTVDSLKAFGVGAAKSATPTAAGIAAGAYTTAATAPVLGPFAPLAGLAAGVGAAGLTSLSQEGYLDFFAPEANQESKRLAAEQPLATALGSAVPGVGAGLAQQGLRSFAGTMSQRLAAGTFSAGYGAGVELAATGQIDPTNAAINFGTGFGQPGVSPRTRTGSVTPEQTFTVYHGSGSRINNQNLDISRGGGLLGEAFYTGINAPDTPGDVASSYAAGKLRAHNFFAGQKNPPKYMRRKQGFEGGIYPISVKGSIDDFAEYRTPLSENPKARNALMAMYEKLGFDKTRKERIIGEGEVGSALLGPTEPDTFRDVPIDFENLSFEDIKDDLVSKMMAANYQNAEVQGGTRMRPESLFRQLAVEAGIPGVKDTIPNEHGALMIQGPMLGIYDRSRVADVGQPFMPSEAAMRRAPSPPPLPPKKKNPLYQNRGGVVYANNGMLIPYRPKGTDTVPAMLTPGEFVVNRDATQRNLGALQAMNRGGRVSYLQEGGMAGGDASILGFSRSLQSATQMLTQFGQVLQQLQNNLPSGPNAEAAPGNGVNTSGIEQFTQQFGQFVEQLAAINLPPVIRVEGQVTANVNFAGAEALKSLSDTTIRQVVEDTVNAEFNKRSRDNEGQF